jgi:hypothetical protein
MTSYTWNGVSGDWNLASDWTPSGGPPTASDTARINGSATDTITVDTADVAKSLTLSDANATLNDDAGGSLIIGGTLTMSNGTFSISPEGDGGLLTVGALDLSGGALNVDSGGELNLNGTLSQTGGTLTLEGGFISGGTIDSTAGTLAIDSGALSGVTFDGPLNLTASGATVFLANGTTVVGSSGSGPGTINVTGSGATLFFANTQTFNNATINLGPTSSNCYLLAGAGIVLTLGPNVTIDANGAAAIIEDSGNAGDGIVNQGNISQTASDTSLYIYGNSFTNSGAITAASSGGTQTIAPTTFANSGRLAISNGDAVEIDSTNFSNTGSITLASGGSLFLDINFTLAGLGTLTNSGGTVDAGRVRDRHRHDLHQFGHDRGVRRHAHADRCGDRDRNGHDLPPLDPGIRRRGVDCCDERRPGHRLHRRRDAPSPEAQELLWRDFGLRGRRYDQAQGLLGLFRHLGDRGCDDADARERLDHTRLRLRRGLYTRRLHHHAGDDHDHQIRMKHGMLRRLARARNASD